MLGDSGSKCCSIHYLTAYSNGHFFPQDKSAQPAGDRVTINIGSLGDPGADGCSTFRACTPEPARLLPKTEGVGDTCAAIYIYFTILRPSQCPNSVRNIFSLSSSVVPCRGALMATATACLDMPTLRPSS